MERACYKARRDALGTGRHKVISRVDIARAEMTAAEAQRLSEECGTIMQKINRSDQWMVLRKHMTLGWSATTPL
jgi:hypothetical protein